MEWNIALWTFSFFIFDWQNLNMIISIFNLSHTNTWNTYQSYTRQTEGAAEADGRRSVVREDRVRAGHHGVQKRGWKGIHNAYRKIWNTAYPRGCTGDKFCTCTYWYIFYITPKFIYSFYQGICLLHRINRIFDIIFSVWSIFKLIDWYNYVHKIMSNFSGLQ